MKLTVVILNYNVKYFLEQCVQSVLEASKNIDTEVIVVDNNSVDGSCQMMKERFPQVALIENTENIGFSKGNNGAMALAKGEYVLLLNPDTLVEEDTFEKCLSYLDEHSDVGGLGVRMIDGKGRFLPESKRGLPTPWVAFCKVFGLSRMFPKSKKFGGYHLGYLPENEVNEVDVLPGSFMMLRKKVLDQIGVLDESFFMYGEDIDLSYRIQLGGYKNVYFPETTIIHYKGESTKKGSVNYVLVFYNAMILFAKKHFSQSYASIFSLLINMAIYFRASIAILRRLISNVFFPVLDGVFIFLGYYFIEPIWESYKFNQLGAYPDTLLKFIVPFYVLIWFASILFSGGYNRPFDVFKVRRGNIIGTILVLLIYALLPENLRFSRALVIFGALWSFISLHLIRSMVNLLPLSQFRTGFGKSVKRIVIVGHSKETDRVYKILQESGVKFELVGFVTANGDQGGKFIGHLKNLTELIRVHEINEIIFCSDDVSASKIISNMFLHAKENVTFKIAPSAGSTIIGSNSIHTVGDLYTIKSNAVSKPENRRVKRLFDLVLGVVLLIVSPVLMWFFKSPIRLLKNLVNTIIGKMSFIGYVIQRETNKAEIFRNGIIYPHDSLGVQDLSNDLKERANIKYVQNYSILNDLRYVFHNFGILDRQL